MSNSIRQLEERIVPHEIVLLRWCDRMDLLALANIRGEVSLHRLTWQKVWSLSPDKEGNLVIDMTWRSDGKILAIAYNSGIIHLVEVENKNILHTIPVEDQVTCISWHLAKTNVSLFNEAEKDMDACDLNDSTKYLPDLPSLSTDFSSTSKNFPENLLDFYFIKKQSNLNVLVIGTKTGNLHVMIFGLFTCFIDNLNINGKAYKILATQFSDSLDMLYVSACDNNNNLQIFVINSSILNTHSKELFAIAIKYGHIISLLSYLDNTMSSITEAWESILLEMDSKLSKYAANVPKGTVSADFLDLLMFGITSDEMEEFLMQDLTDKGLKKLGHSIELSYSNIQKLLLKHLNKVGQNITYHLAELKGMARLAHRYKVLGLREETVAFAIISNGSFLVKSVEVQQVINHSMTNYKAFFRWLYVVILRLMDEQVPPEIPKMAQQDLAYITEFLQNFDKIGASEEGTKSGFNLERLGQYLVDAPLKILPNNENNLWHNFLEENECVAENEVVIKHYESMSLVQQHQHLIKAIDSVFEDPKNVISNCLVECSKTVFNCINMNSDSIMSSFFNYDSNVTCYSFVHNDGCYFLELSNELNFSIKGGFLHISQIPEVSETNIFKIFDVKFYSLAYISLLLDDTLHSNSYMCQVPVLNVRDLLIPCDLKSFNLLCLDVPKIDIAELPALTFKRIDGMSASTFAVSGLRHVSVVLSDNQRKVQLFEMEADEEEEEETDITSNTTKDSENMKIDESHN